MTWFIKLIKLIKKQAIHFCSNTELHGYKYIGHSQRSIIDRCIWGAIVIIAILFSLMCMYKAYYYNSKYATLAIIESIHHGVWHFAFPAVTVCNHNQISRRKAKNFAYNLKILNGLTKEYIFEEMKLLMEMLDPGIYEYDIHLNLTILQDVFEANNYTTVQVMNLVKQDCSKLIRNCKWKGNDTPCEKLFEPTYARDGLCCSFNYFHSESQINKKGYPKRINACGYQSGLTFYAYPEPEDYFASLYPSYGVKIQTHYAYDYPVRSSEFKFVGLGMLSFLGVTPQEFYSTPAVSKLSLATRKCTFHGELPPTSLAATYSYVNCLNDCRARVIVERCGCSPFYLPLNGTKVCELKDLKCMSNIRDVYDTSWPGFEVESVNIPDVSINVFNRPCGCLPDCTVRNYPVGSTQSQLHKDFIDDNHLTNFGDFSIISIFYTDLLVIRYRQISRFNWRNLFASFGGILGLFAGFSIISGFEFIYFFMIRTVADYYIKKTTKLDKGRRQIEVQENQ